VYVGRIVAVGKTTKPFAAYRVSSRSFPNRVAKVVEDGVVAIQPLDPDDMKKNPYIAYNCLRTTPRGIVVSNGTHTDAIAEVLASGATPDTALQQVLNEMGYEKDEFNTPRIAGIITDTMGYLGIVRADAVEVTGFELVEGVCRFICTYELDRIDGKNHPFIAKNAAESAKQIYEQGVFEDFEKPVCAAAWMEEFAVYNPHE